MLNSLTLQGPDDTLGKNSGVIQIRFERFYLGCKYYHFSENDVM